MKTMKISLLSSAIVSALMALPAVAHQQDGTTVSTQLQTAVSEVKDITDVKANKTEAEKLAALTLKFFNESLEQNPVMATFYGVSDYNDKFNEPLSEAVIAKSKAHEQTYLAAINAIDASKLSGQDWISYHIFKSDREHAIAGYQFGSQYMPINQMYGVHTFFPMLGSGQSAQPFATVKDYENFISRTKGYVEFIDSVILYMKKGIEEGVVLPTAITEKMVPQLSAHIVKKASESVFYGPVNQLEKNEDISDDEKARLAAAYEGMITEMIVPSYQKLHDFVVEEYLPHTRATVGYSDLPNGKAWYEYKIKDNTTLPLSADEVHEFGLSEVSRILGEMKAVKETVGFEGDLAAFFDHLRTDDKFYFESDEALIKAYTDVKTDIDARLPTLFSVFPKADYIVKAVEPYREASSAAASYMSPAPDGSRPGIFYINTRDLKAQPKFSLETLSIHEAAPGHHFQIAIQQEVEGLPLFRKFNGYTVFSEGWALYAESLGKELGMFTDPYMWYGRLNDEQLRAMRLVVDTGLHAKGWSREKAIAYMLENSSMAESDAVAEVERYISIPGQALAYKVGERHIRHLRNQATEALGDDFDIKAFHSNILTDGAMPMPILSEKMSMWIDDVKSKSQGE